MPVELIRDLQVADPAVPEEAWFSLCVDHLKVIVGDPVLDRLVCVRICSEDASRDLNRDYRGKDQPTNVLSFPADFEFAVDDAPLGDLAICWNVVCREADAQNKQLDEHLAHLTIHGVLHLLGFDHEEPTEAVAMEKVEVETLASLGVQNPYIAR